MIGPIHVMTLGLFQNFFDGPDILIVALVALLLFGKRLPDIARSLGRTIVEFKKGLNQTSDEINRASQEDTPPEKPTIAAPTSANPRQIKQVTNVSEEP
jgi:sec-independent protein translocase protein TatA